MFCKGKKSNSHFVNGKMPLDQFGVCELLFVCGCTDLRQSLNILSLDVEI